MKKITITIVLTILFCIITEPLFACTSFAVYSNQIIYGMNFDFMNVPMKFLIATNGDMHTFHLAFERTVGETKFFVNTAGMNSNGLFASCQEIHPVEENPPEKTDENIYIFQLYDAIAQSKSVEEIKKKCKAKYINFPGISVHNLFADKTGSAIITETGEKEGLVIRSAIHV